jgi:hypothetical protein
VHRIRFILTGAVLGVAWSSSLRGFMQQVAGPDSEFTFAGTFGIILLAGATTGALLGWAEYQRRAGHQYRLLIAAPLVIGIAPLVQPGALRTLLTTGGGLAPAGLALLAMIGGYSVSGRGPRWARIAAGLVALADVLVVGDTHAPGRTPARPRTRRHRRGRLISAGGSAAGLTADSDGTAGVAVLLQVALVVFLGPVERRRRGDLGDDLPFPRLLLGIA